jgi:ankyrin repeat protein
MTLIASGMDLNFEEEDWGTPLSLALIMGENGVFRALLDHGADPNRGDDSALLLISSAKDGNVEAARMLLDRGVKPDGKDDSDATPLMYAAQAGSKELVNFLLARGANPRLRDFDGHDASDYAARAKHPELAELLRAARKK